MPFYTRYWACSFQAQEVDSSCIIPKANGRSSNAQSKAKGRQKCPKGQPQTGTGKRPPAKPRRRKDQEISIPPPISLSHVGANDQLQGNDGPFSQVFKSTLYDAPERL